MSRYEIHFYNTPKDLLIPIEEIFYDFNWEMGLAATKYYMIKTAASVVIKFISTTKPYALIGKEQFFSRIYYECLEENIDPDEMDIYFMSNEKSDKVLLDKYSKTHV